MNMEKKKVYKRGFFDHDTMTVKFGGELSKPENKFICQAIKVPAYKYNVKERESLGGGWYGSMETNEYEQNNLFIIVKDRICIGQMMPYAKFHGIASYLMPCNKQALKMAEQMNIPYQYLSNN